MDIMKTDTENRTLSDKFMLRLPDGMRDRIKAAADASNRSMNAEIVATLEEKYPGSDFDLGGFITEWSKRLNETNDPLLINSMTATANKQLEAASSEWRLETSIVGGNIAVRFVNAVGLGQIRKEAKE